MATTHRIRRHTLDLHYHGAADGARLRSDAADWQKRVWMPMLEKALDEYGAGDETIVIDRLDIDLESLDAVAWQESAGAEALRKLETILQQKLAASAGRTLPAAHRDLDALACYLRTGAVPWWAPLALRTDPRAWLHSWMESTASDALAAAVRPLLSSAAARARLAAELSEEMFWALVSALAGGAEVDFWKQEYGDCERLLKRAGQPCEKYCVACRAAVLGACLYIPDAAQTSARFVAELTPLLAPDARRVLGAHLDGLMGKPALTAGPVEGGAAADTAKDLGALLAPDALIFSDAMVEDDEREDEVNHYITNGGLVLLAPFLPAFFTQSGVVKEGGAIADAGKAVALLGYAVGGTDDHREWQSLLPKILCGVAPQLLIPTGSVVLSAEEKDATDALLAAVIEHWAVLKNTSPDGLRQSFLRRDGRLTEKEGAWRLLVQPQAHDVLLRHLPWTIGVIKLPWMAAPLYVDWE